jgi:hypothetical protein
MSKLVHYLMIATHLPSDSELIFFNTVEEAKAEFQKRVDIIFAMDGLEQYIDYSIEDEYAVRFNAGNNEELSGYLEDVDHYFKVGTQDVEDDCDYYIANFDEHVDDSYVKFFNKENVIITYNDMVDNALEDNNKGINRYDNTTWEDENNLLFKETDNKDGSTDAFFGFMFIYWVYRIGKVNIDILN